MKVLRIAQIRPFGEYIKAVALPVESESGLEIIRDDVATTRFLVSETGGGVLDVEADDIIWTARTAGLQMVDEVDGEVCWLIRESSVLAVEGRGAGEHGA